MQAGAEKPKVHKRHQTFWLPWQRLNEDDEIRLVTMPQDNLIVNL